MVYLELAIVFVLLLLNGALAMSELAVVSARRSRMEQLAREGRPGAKAALRLAEDPGRFLSSVQIGITLVGIIAGAFGGATLAERLGGTLNRIDWIAPNGTTVAYVLVVAVITYLSLIIGELVPKRVALSNPERVAMLVAPPMTVLARIAAPAVWLLDQSSRVVLRLLRIPEERQSTVTEEEVRALIAEGTRSGVFAEKERELIENVIRTADRSVRSVMTPRSEIAWIAADADLKTVRERIAGTQYARLLVCEGSIDEAIGLIDTKDIVDALLANQPVNLRQLMSPPLIVPDRTPVLRLIDLFRREGVHLAVVVDEYGTTEGLVTATDILEAISGLLPEQSEEEEPMVVERSDGSFLVDGMMPIDAFEQRFDLSDLRGDGDFETLAGLILEHLGHLPETGETLAVGPVDFEIVDLDGRRIDKVLVRRRAATIELGP